MKYIKVEDFPEWTVPILGYQYKWEITEKRDGYVCEALAGDKNSLLSIRYIYSHNKPWCIAWSISSKDLSKQTSLLQVCLVETRGNTLRMAATCFEKAIKNIPDLASGI